MATLEDKFDKLIGQNFHGESVSKADSFAYTDPVDGSVSKNQGLRVEFESGSRFVIRLSGTGTVGATLRLYLEKYATPNDDLQEDTQNALKKLASIADQIGHIKSILERDYPSVIS
jgi:phosphoglucomutase